MARCPFHDDASPSLRLIPAPVGRAPHQSAKRGGRGVTRPGPPGGLTAPRGSTTTPAPARRGAPGGGWPDQTGGTT